MAVQKLLLKQEGGVMMRAPGFCTDKVVASSVGVEEHLCRTAWSFNGAGAGCGLVLALALAVASYLTPT